MHLMSRFSKAGSVTEVPKNVRILDQKLGLDRFPEKQS